MLPPSVDQIHILKSYHKNKTIRTGSVKQHQQQLEARINNLTASGTHLRKLEDGISSKHQTYPPH